MAANYALILAGGSGSRLQNPIPKVFLKINKLYILEYSLIGFSNAANIDHIILVVPQDYLQQTQDLVQTKNYTKVVWICQGGNSRFESSMIAVNAIKESEANVLIHDAARPFISETIINKCISALKNDDAVNVLTPLSDSLVQLNPPNTITTIDRSQYRQVQTPQGFRLSSIKKAQQLALKQHQQEITDDFSLVLQYKTGSTTWIEGNRLNFKITMEEDLELARHLPQHTLVSI
ncbi:MAG: NTP transferase domain-containing protein [Bacteroidales bacterium]|nr:NTP transferase domain-containing protein [Bacteroidales bacterium]